LTTKPTETESVETLDAFVEALRQIADEAVNNSQIVLDAPHVSPVQRVDEVYAAKNLNVAWVS
jgi:glycine dehydrogenase subunit 2